MRIAKQAEKWYCIYNDKPDTPKREVGMSVLDSYHRNITYLRLSVTELCNLRCRYCMPEEGVYKKRHEDMLTQEEMLRAVRVCASLGVQKVRITGGEPLVKPNILALCRETAATEGIEELCLTTNGTLLPKFAQALKEAGVERLNISLDTLDETKYRRITRGGELADAQKGIDTALSAGFRKIKINTVLIGGFNTDEIASLAELTCQAPVDVRFIELMPIGNSREFGPEAYVPNTVVLGKLPELEALPADGSVAKLYHLPGAQGNIGLISPVSAHFCAACNRIRITADGKVKPCLHSSDEITIKGMDEEQMRETIKTAILDKPQWHGELSYYERSHAARNMNQIGG